MNADGERERETLLQALVPHVGHLLTEEALMYMVDDLLDRWAVIVPPCKVGDKVYWYNGILMLGKVVRGLFIDCEKNIQLIFDNFAAVYPNEQLYLTREEAERALKERENNV